DNSSGSQGLAQLPEMVEDGKYAVIAALLDPSQQTTRTPLTPILFSPERIITYNKIVTRFERLIKRFYESPDGFLFGPERLDRRQQEEINSEILGIGRDISELIPVRSPISAWFNTLFGDPDQDRYRRAGRAEEQHLTIITNDFNIPWYWMRVGGDHRLLCEVCSLGMLQLANRNAVELDADFDQ